MNPDEVVENNDLLREWAVREGFAKSNEERFVGVTIAKINRLRGEKREQIYSAVYSGNNLMRQNRCPIITGKTYEGVKLDAWDFSDFARKKMIAWIGLDENLARWDREIKSIIENQHPDLNVEINVESKNKILISIHKEGKAKSFQAYIEKIDSDRYWIQSLAYKKEYASGYALTPDWGTEIPTSEEIVSQLMDCFAPDNNFCNQSKS